MHALLLSTLLAAPPASGALAPRVRPYPSPDLVAVRVEASTLDFGSSPLGRAASRLQVEVLDEIVKEAAAFAREVESEGMIIENPWEVDFQTEATAVTPRIISWVQTGMTYTGGAHPSHYILASTFFLKAGRPVKASYQDLLPGRASRSLSPRLIRILQKQGASFYGEKPKPLGPVLLNNFSVTRQGVTWSFPHYSVGAYAEGVRTVFLPWKSLPGHNPALRP